MKTGLEEIADLLELYSRRENLYLVTSSWTTALEIRFVALYKIMLEYEIRAYVHLSRRSFQRGLRNMIKADSWEQLSKEVHESDVRCTDLMDLVEVEKNQLWRETQLDHLQKQAAVNRKTIDIVASVLGQQRQLRFDDSASRCLAALSFDYERQKNMNLKRARSTCNWLFNDPRFLQWKGSKSAMLWISVSPGCGKSVLSRSLVDDH